MMSLKSADDVHITVAAAAIWSLLYNSVRVSNRNTQYIIVYVCSKQ